MTLLAGTSTTMVRLFNDRWITWPQKSSWTLPLCGSTILPINVLYGTIGILVKQPLKLKDVCRISWKESGINKVLLTGSWKELKIAEGIQEKNAWLAIHKTLIREYLKAEWQRNCLGEKNNNKKKWGKNVAPYHDCCYQSSLVVL